MDLNLVVLSGRLAAAPEMRVLDSGTRLVRYLVTLRTETPRRRVDVLPVTLWEPSDDAAVDLEKGRRVWVAGSAQRRFWEGPEGRRSRIEIVAEQVTHDIAEEPESAAAKSRR
jgi:single-stranded DNA-binding protein